MSQEEYAVDDRDEVVEAVRESLVSKLVVEFLQQGGPKPHVVFRLDINPLIKAKGNTWMGCRLAMDLEGDYDGIFHITPLKYSGSSHAAHAAFEFSLKRGDWTVNHIISTVDRDPNLLNFSFQGGFKLPGSNIEYFDGCRDFISQFFIVLHRWGLVGWHVHKIERGTFDGENLRVELGKTGFHQIMGYNYTINPVGSTIVSSLPLARGTFWDEGFRRILSYRVAGKHPYQLPYTPQTLQEGDDGYNSSNVYFHPQQNQNQAEDIVGTSAQMTRAGPSAPYPTPNNDIPSDPFYVSTWHVEGDTEQYYEFCREDGGRIRTEGSDWKSEQVSYDGNMVGCWMYTGKKTGKRYYTWELGSGTNPKGTTKGTGKGKGKSKETGKGKGVQK